MEGIAQDTVTIIASQTGAVSTIFTLQGALHIEAPTLSPFDIISSILKCTCALNKCCYTIFKGFSKYLSS